MKLQKEIWIVIAAVAFLVAWLIDRLGGPVSILVGNPIAFLQSSVLLHKYPFTATAIIIRTAAIFISSMLALSIIEKRYFTKAVILFFVGLLAEFYAIQQLATGSHITNIQWTLSIAYASLSLVIGILAMILQGIWSLFNKGEEKAAPYEESIKGNNSILEPPKE